MELLEIRLGIVVRQLFTLTSILISKLIRDHQATANLKEQEHGDCGSLDIAVYNRQARPPPLSQLFCRLQSTLSNIFRPRSYSLVQHSMPAFAVPPPTFPSHLSQGRGSNIDYQDENSYIAQNA